MKASLTLTFIACTWSVHAATLTLATATNSKDYMLSNQGPIIIPLTKADYQLTISDIGGHCQVQPSKRLFFNRPIALNCSVPNQMQLPIRFPGEYVFSYDNIAHTILVKRQLKDSASKKFVRPLPNVLCPRAHHHENADGRVTIDLNNAHDIAAFADGEQLREVLSQQIVTVRNGTISIKPNDKDNGLLLLERAKIGPTPNAPTKQPLNWRNANLYFVILDRFNNGNPHNDESYGRHKDGQQEIGTFHGGDLRGLINKLDYIQSLGTDAIWVSPIVEQVHGFIGGGEKGRFPFYAYHGYWARDFTKIDANFGQESDLKELVSKAHKRGLKILLDIVINHPGYPTLADIQHDHINVVTSLKTWPQQWSDWHPKAEQNWHSYHQQIRYQSRHWHDWWGEDWVRANLPGYPKPGSSNTTLSVAGLPDFLTESQKSVIPPQWLLRNRHTKVISRKGYRVADYLIEWQSDWVKRFGIDGYRVDTVKHVEGDVWRRLKFNASQKLTEWRRRHHQTGQPFWMMGEVWGLGAYQSPDYHNGFDALLNFDLQKQIDKGAACLKEMDSTYQYYADSMQQNPNLNPVSYISSHDTELFFARFRSFAMQKGAASALLLTPGAIQVYYGDEIARDLGPYGDDFHQGTRSDMIWTLDAKREELLSFWRKLGQFRHQHPAVGAGIHTMLPQKHGYAFSRTLGHDKVVVFIGR